MKIECRCGRMIIDQTDCLPHKAHLIPDQEWFQVHDDLDSELVDRLVDNSLDRDTAYMKSRMILTRASRLMWQCRACGRLYIDDRDGKPQCYVPATDETEKAILEGHGGEDDI